MKYTLPLAIGAIGLLLGSCASERTTFLKGNTIEWQAKNAPSVQEPTAVVIQETAATTESASLDNSALPLEIASPMTEQPAVSEAPAEKSAVARAERRTSTVAPVEVAEAPATIAVENAAVSAAAPKTPEPVSGGKSQLIALILCFFLGGLGIHRFYLGYTWQGIVQLLTAGGFLIWALIDLVRIIIGDLEPKDGSYDKTL